jgi:glutamate synthase domain-containing protein 2
MYLAWCQQLKHILGRLGMKSIKELVGRSDLLVHVDYMKREEIKGEIDG